MSGFPIRGIIEGFYGTPWTHEQRLDMIDYLAEIGMTTLVYSPKDDPYIRRRWRDLYPTAELAALAELADAARTAGLRLQFALSPGLSMRYSDPADTAAILAKLGQVAGLGVTSFALFVDDIPGELQHAPDRDRFATLVHAQVAVSNDVHRRLGDSIPNLQFAVCPTQYWGHGDEPYIAALGRGLTPGISLYWTGRAICSPEIEVRDAQVFANATGKPPLYWDNFPVNDVAMTGELHIGPYHGREAGLTGVAEGIIANAMPLAEASKIAFASIADFTRDPEGFDAEASWEAALARIAGPEDAEALREFADANRGSALCLDDAPRLAGAMEQFTFDYEFGDRATAIATLRTRVEAMLATTAPLAAPRNVALGREIAPWLAHYRTGLESLLRAVARVPVAGTGTPPAVATAEQPAIMADLLALRATRLRVFGDALDMFLSDLAGEFSRP